MRHDRRAIPDPGRRGNKPPLRWPIGVGVVALLLYWSGLTAPAATSRPAEHQIPAPAVEAPLMGRNPSGEEFICWFNKGPLERFCMGGGG